MYASYLAALYNVLFPPFDFSRSKFDTDKILINEPVQMVLEEDEIVVMGASVVVSPNDSRFDIFLDSQESVSSIVAGRDENLVVPN